MNQKLMRVLLMLPCLCSLSYAQMPSSWKSHDMRRPRPVVVHPGAQALPVAPPSDAVVLFDGHDLSQWRSTDGSEARWTVTDGSMEVNLAAGSIRTRDAFGDVQLHLEWWEPRSNKQGQSAGNSGVYFMGLYEVQILESYEATTYPDGQAGALYGQHPPLFNAALPPETWQAFDIVFRRPRFDHDGKVVQPARLTVFHNGILVQDAFELSGPTMWLQPLPYSVHPDQLPLMLQNHGARVRFRNIWLRRLPEFEDNGPVPSTRPVVVLTEEELNRYAGEYRYDRGSNVTLKVEGGVLQALFLDHLAIDLIPRSREEFELRWTAARIVFDLDPQGVPTALTFHIGGESRSATRVGR